MNQEREEFRATEVLGSILPSSMAVGGLGDSLEGQRFLGWLQGTFTLVKKTFSRGKLLFMQGSVGLLKNSLCNYLN